jgi:hypothetical protein
LFPEKRWSDSLLFDPYKLDISDEFKRVIGSLRANDGKIRTCCVEQGWPSQYPTG